MAYRYSLDGSCNGYQHISTIFPKLAKSVNVINDPPEAGATRSWRGGPGTRNKSRVIRRKDGQGYGGTDKDGMRIKEYLKEMMIQDGKR